MTSDQLAKRYGLHQPEGPEEELLAQMCDAFARGGENQLASACARALRLCQEKGNASTTD